jgi:hypothetical protein|tara:strand:+ start:4189 stop:4350 length:162 start_codon:yes stop_codon:yes gene_type:complete
VIFEINLTISVDKSANFLEAFGNNVDVISEQIQYALYDIDDIEVLDCEVLHDK